MSYQIQEFKINDSSAYLTGKNYFIDQTSEEPVSICSISQKNDYEKYKRFKYEYDIIYIERIQKNKAIINQIISDNNYYNISDFYMIEPNTSFFAYIPGSSSVDKITFYDINYNFISKISSYDVQLYVNVPTDAYFLRICSDNSDTAYISSIISKNNNSYNSFRYNYATSQNSFHKHYIKNSTGEIKTSGASGYHTVKIYLESGEYIIRTKFTSTVVSDNVDIMWKYTDSTFNTPEKAIITNIDIKKFSDSRNYINKKYILETGYYAILCFIGQEEYIENSIEVYNIKDFSQFIENSIYNSQLPVFIPSMNQYDINNIQYGYYITLDGIIEVSGIAYYLAKSYINKGKYLISGPGSLHSIIVKYTDDTYTVPENIVLSNTKICKHIINLESGYYGISWQSDTNEKLLIQDYSSVIDFIIDNYITEHNNLIVYENIIQSYYINSELLIDNAQENYTLAKFYVPENNNYKIDKNIKNIHNILVKYTDDTYTEPESLIIGNSTDYIYIDGVYYLMKGYYALASNNYNFNMNVYKYDNHEFIYELKKFKYESGIHGFNEFEYNDENTNAISDNEIELNDTGYYNRAYVPYVTYEDDFIMGCTITPKEADTNGDFSILIGRKSNTTSTMLRIKKTNSTNTISFCNNNNNEIFTDIVSFEMTGIKYELNKPIYLTFRKYNDKKVCFSVSVTDSYGNTYSNDRVTDVMYGHDYILTYAETGKFNLKNFHFGYEKDINNIKLIVIGHSFVEGLNSTVNDIDKRWAKMLANDIGDRNTVIFGRGGGSYDMISKIIRQLEWVSSARYAIICLGTNCPDTSGTSNIYMHLHQKLQNLNIKPIWLNITPSRDGTIEKPYLNSFIENNFDYVDVRSIFYNEDGTVNKTLYADNVHPTIDGYYKMYQVIKASCPQLFSI